MCACVSMACLCAHAYACARVQRPEEDVDHFVLLFSTVFLWDKVSYWTWSYTGSQQALWCTCPCPRVLVCDHTQFFTWSLNPNSGSYDRKPLSFLTDFIPRPSVASRHIPHEFPINCIMLMLRLFYCLSALQWAQLAPLIAIYKCKCYKFGWAQINLANSARSHNWLKWSKHCNIFKGDKSGHGPSKCPSH